jgi:branched-chain amino acid transport system permease protein
VHPLTLFLADGNSWINFDVTSFKTLFWDNTFNGLTYGAIYSLIAMGYTLVYGVLRLINFAHSEVFISGAFAVWFTLSYLGFGGADPGLSPLSLVGDLLLAVVAAMAVSGIVAIILERVAYRPLRKRNAPPLVFLITAIGASFFIQYVWYAFRGANAESAVIMFVPHPIFTVFGTNIDDQQLTIVAAAILVMVVVDRFINHTRFGRGIRAVAQDPDTATLMGVNKERIIMITFLVGGLLAGIAALFYVMKVPSGVQYNGGFNLGIKAFAAAVLGGIGNIRGAMLGGVLIGLIGDYGQTLLGASEWSDIIAFVALVVILMFRPTGVLGESLGKARV